MTKKKDRCPVSVCMATYNGIDYIKVQIESILLQLNDCDELLISDDGSSDGTLEYVNQLAKENSIVKVFNGPGKGANANFFYLIGLAQNDIILISDQDDYWFPNKIDSISKTFEDNPGVMMVLHSDIIYYSDLNQFVKCTALRHGKVKNLIKSSYSGHRMAFRKDFRSLILSNTKLIPSYDQYLGLLAEKHNCCTFLDSVLDIHYMHGNNVTRPLPLLKKIKLRLQLLFSLMLSK